MCPSMDDPAKWRVGAAVEAKVLALRGKGRGMRAIARELRIGNCTVQKIISAA